MLTVDPTYELELDSGWVVVAEPLDADSTEALSRRFSDVTSGRVAVQVAPTDTFDVSGHAAGSTALDVILTIDDDVEGHAFSLRFPTPQDADRMRTRFAAGGLLVAVLTVASIGVGSQLSAPQVGAPAPAAAPAAAPFVNRDLNPDIRSGVNIQDEPAATPAIHGELKD